MTKIINKNYKNYQQKIQEMNDFTNESALMEADTKKDDEAGLTDEELREIALDIAIDMSKLMEKECLSTRFMHILPKPRQKE